jgi:peroxiredoxin Q/BCP
MSSLAEGNKAPDFMLEIAENKALGLKDLTGKNVVLYFYPKDDTPGCTVEAKDFRDLMDEFTANNTVIIGVSKDSLKSHDKFKEKYCLPFELGSDIEGTACAAYGVWVEKSMYGKKYMGIERTTFLINKEGIIRKIWRKVSVTNHAKEVLVEAKKVNYV